MNETFENAVLAQAPKIRAALSLALTRSSDREFIEAVRGAVEAPREIVSPLLWLACRMHTQDDLQPGWDLLGVYTSEDLAAARCRLYEHFIAPIESNTALEHSAALMGIRWPVRERSKSQGVTS